MITGEVTNLADRREPNDQAAIAFHPGVVHRSEA